jgi:hypothetical protein
LTRAFVIAALAVSALLLLPVHDLDAQRRPRRVPALPEPLRVSALNDMEFPNVLPGVPRVILFSDSHHAGLFEISGPNGASVRADFTLPSALIGDIGGTLLPVSFGPGDGLVTQTRNVLIGLPFNPMGPVIGSLSGLGFLYLHLGGTAHPGLPQNGGLYRATIILTVSDLGS